MRHPYATRTLGRTAVLGVWLVALALAGEPRWLSVVLGVALVLVWASPYLLASTRHGAVLRPAMQARPAGEAGRPA